MKNILLVLFTVLIFFTGASAQQAIIKGKVMDSVERKNLQYSNVVLVRTSDSVIVSDTRADIDGAFQLNRLQKGKYKLIISYPKMADYINELQLDVASEIKLGSIGMELKANLLNEIQIIAAKSAISRKGDTIVYQADSFKVAEHANVEELLKRLPGVEIDINGKVTAQGRDVKKIFVDGDEFFGDDPLMVTRYLKAKGVSEVQVYERKSKEADFTGIDDGIRETTMNVKLKENAKNGYLSALDLKSATSTYKDIGAQAAVYLKRFKAGIVAQQTNLDQTSIAGSIGGFGSEYDTYKKIDSKDEGIPADGNNLYNNASGSGLPDKLKLGAYLSGKWKTKNEAILHTNYLDNEIENFNSSNLEELLPNGSILKNFSNNTNTSRNKSADIKGQISIELDTLSTLNIDFRAKRNAGGSSGLIANRNTGNEGILLSANSQTNNAKGDSEVFNGNINYSKKFTRKGRSIIIDVQPERKRGNNLQSNVSNISYYNNDGDLLRSETLNLRKEDRGDQTSFASRIAYTEPLTQKLSLLAGYTFKGVASSSNKQTYDNSEVVHTTRRIDSLSNNFRYNSFTNIGRAIFQYKYKRLTASTGMEVTQTNFKLRDLDTEKAFDRNYINLAPNSNINMTMNGGYYLNLIYSGDTRQPSITQLQPIREIDNPFFQVKGNPDLKPAFRNNFAFMLSKISIQDASFSVVMHYDFVKNAIISSQTVDQFNKRVTSFLNTNGNNAFGFSLSHRNKVKGTKLTYETGLDYSIDRGISMINAVRNEVVNNYYMVNGRLRYNGGKFYFSSYSSVRLTDGKSSLGILNQGTSIQHSHLLEGNVKLPLKMEFRANANLEFKPAGAGFDRSFNIYRLDSELSAKLLKNESLQLKVTANDIFNQQTGYIRTVSGNSTSETTSSYIRRFFLLGLTWKLNGNFIINDKKS